MQESMASASRLEDELYTYSVEDRRAFPSRLQPVFVNDIHRRIKGNEN